jgi:hypothetical protein
MSMSTNVRVILIVFCTVVIVLVLFVYASFFGLPWKKWYVGGKINTYLENKYGEEFIIQERFYNFKDGSYGIKVSPQNNYDLTFSAWEGYGNYNLIDYYAEAIWERQASEDFTKLVNDIYPNYQRIFASVAYGEGMEFVKEPPIPNYADTPALMTLGVNLLMGRSPFLKRNNAFSHNPYFFYEFSTPIGA